MMNVIAFSASSFCCLSSAVRLKLQFEDAVLSKEFPRLWGRLFVGVNRGPAREKRSGNPLSFNGGLPISRNPSVKTNSKGCVKFGKYLLRCIETNHWLIQDVRGTPCSMQAIRPCSLILEVRPDRVLCTDLAPELFDIPCNPGHYMLELVPHHVLL